MFIKTCYNKTAFADSSATNSEKHRAVVYLQYEQT